MAKNKKHTKLKTPIFLSDKQEHAFRFILEEEPGVIKENYTIGNKTYKEVEWEAVPCENRILVRINEHGESELIIPFRLENFPVLQRFLDNLYFLDD